MPSRLVGRVATSGEDLCLLGNPMPPVSDHGLLGEILANMFAGVALVRVSDATIVYANAQWAGMFGYQPWELAGQPIWIVNAPGKSTPTEVSRAIIACLRARGAWSGELENVRKDGTHLWTQANVTTFEHPRHGTVWVMIQLDITDQKRAAEALRRSEERLGLILKVTGAGAWDWNIQTGEVLFSPFWITSLGYALEEVPPRVDFWETIVHPDDLPRVHQALTEHFAGVTPVYECVTRLRRKNGAWQWNLDRGQVVERTASGEPLRMVGTDTDLSQQQWSGLREFIAICAGCKQIREDGTWRAIESHFGKRSLVRFSHGLCPDCAGRYSMDPPAADS